MVPEAYPPSPLVTSHSRSSRAASSGRSPGAQALVSTSSCMDLPFVGWAGPAINSVLRRPQHSPVAALGRSEERFRNVFPVQLAAEVHEQQSIVAAAHEIADHEGLFAEHGAVDPARVAGLEHLIGAAQP